MTSRPLNLFEYEEIAKQHLEPMALDYYSIEVVLGMNLL